MPEKIFFSVFAVFMLLITILKRDRITIILTCTLTIAALTLLFDIEVISIIGQIILTLGLLGIAIYPIRIKTLSKFEKSVIAAAGWLMFIKILFATMNWPFGGLFNSLGIVPIILFLIYLYRGYFNSKEFGFLCILNIYFAERLIVQFKPILFD